MKLKIHFILKRGKKKRNGECPIYVRYTYLGKRVENATGIYLRQDMWNASLQRSIAKGRERDDVNNRLSKIRSKLNDTFYKLEAIGDRFDVYNIKEDILQIDTNEYVMVVFDYYLNSIRQKLYKGYSKETFKHYKTSRNRLAKFIYWKYRKYDVTLSTIDYRFLDAFDMYLKMECGAHQNTAWNYHKHLRRVLNLAISLDYIAYNPYSRYKVPLEPTYREFLTIEEVRKIETADIDLPVVSMIRDIFIFACYTGLAYADLSKLNSSHIQKRDDGNIWIIIQRTKTKNRCIVPLFPNVQRILDKYDNHPYCIEKGTVLPVYVNQKMNSYLKEVARVCGIAKNLTMHMARHTFATSISLSNGVPIETVAKMLGHTSLKTTQIYARIVESKISEEMMELQKKLGM
ncbi:site-specific integrase [Carboxylicivirga sp. RSCT41]|uniref:site-specific integrase n=1 Tax=Carboxylicivirga agarovorans TaxID=3417570 RepID=UPI003D335F07